MSISLPVDAKTKAGIVILSKGEFYAIDNNKQKRKLKRRSLVFEGDILSTGIDSISQVRFIDNAVISLRANTSLRIDEYQKSANAAQGKENGVLHLLKGGFRTITGAINKNNYRVKTDVASIGIRGTEYEVVLFNGLNVAAWNGSVTINNRAGNIALGLGEKHNFATVSGENVSPVGLLHAPSSLMPRSSPVFKFANKAKVKSFKNKPVKPAAFTNKKSVFNVIGSKLKKAYFNPNAIVNNIETVTVPTAEKQRDITKVNLDRLGLVVISGANKPKFFGGKASTGSAGSPVITDNGFGPHELPDFLLAPPNVAFWRNGALVTNHVNTVINNKEISYGKWNATSTNSPIMQVDPLATAGEVDINNTIYWITAQPTAPLVVANRSGTASYGFGSNFLGRDNFGTLSTQTSSMTVNFDTNAVSGTLVFDVVSTSTWTINFNGTIKQNVLDVSVNPSSTVAYGAGPKSIDGDLPMVFTGANADAAAGIFNLEEVGNPDVHAEGVFVLEEGL